ncbi:MAG: hypothetical protein D6735_13155, partial [Acidobacteria bacterium]
NFRDWISQLYHFYISGKIYYTAARVENVKTYDNFKHLFYLAYYHKGKIRHERLQFNIQIPEILVPFLKLAGYSWPTARAGDIILITVSEVDLLSVGFYRSYHLEAILMILVLAIIAGLLYTAIKSAITLTMRAFNKNILYWPINIFAFIVFCAALTFMNLDGKALAGFGAKSAIERLPGQIVTVYPPTVTPSLTPLPTETPMPTIPPSPQPPPQPPPQPQPQPQPQETPTAEPEFTATPRPQNTATPVPPEIVFLPLPVNPISTSAPTPTHTSAPTPIAAPIITYIVELNNIVPTVYPRTGLTIEVKVCEGERGQTRCQADNPPLHNALVQYTDAEENIQFAVTDDSGKANLRNVKPRTVVIAQAIGYTGQIPGYVPADSNKTLDIIMIKEPIESYGGIWFVPLIPFLLIALLLIVVIFLSYMIYINNSRLSNFLRYAFMAVSSMIPAHNEMLLMLRFANLFNLYGVKIKNIYEIQLRYFSDKGCILTILGDDGNYILASDGAYKEYYHDITPKGVKKLTGLASYELSLAWNEMIRLKHIQSPITMIGAWYLFKEDNRAKPQKQHP